MSGRYPIVERRRLRPFFRWHARNPLVAGEYETLVYEVGSEFVTGEAGLAARARSVSVVDLRRNVRIEVLHRHVIAIFRCTVEDPVAVAAAWRRTFAVRDLHRFLTLRMRYAETSVPGMRIVRTRVHEPSRYSSPIADPDDDDYTEA